jgi:hypothetical protein
MIDDGRNKVAIISIASFIRLAVIKKKSSTRERTVAADKS